MSYKAVAKKRGAAKRRSQVRKTIRKKQPLLAGLAVSGCSACAYTYEDESCPGCGNPGLVPRHR
jgi:hypothetical protein